MCLKGGKEYLMRAHFGLPSVESEELDAKRPILVNFEIPYFTVSGIQVWAYVRKECIFALFQYNLHLDMYVCFFCLFFCAT